MTEVEYTDEFGNWWNGLTEAEQESVGYGVGLLEAKGPAPGHSYSSGVEGSRHSHRPDKTGDRRFYEMTPIADRLYDEHLEQLKREGLS